MFIGTCINCNAGFLQPSPDKLPVYEKYTCDECGEQQWLKHSRIDPTSYSLDMMEVDENTHTIKLKTTPE